MDYNLFSYIIFVQHRKKLLHTVQAFNDHQWIRSHNPWSMAHRFQRSSPTLASTARLNLTQHLGATLSGQPLFLRPVGHTAIQRLLWTGLDRSVVEPHQHIQTSDICVCKHKYIYIHIYVNIHIYTHQNIYIYIFEQYTDTVRSPGQQQCAGWTPVNPVSQRDAVATH